jgi:hypothetical protein
MLLLLLLLLPLLVMQLERDWLVLWPLVVLKTMRML